MRGELLILLTLKLSFTIGEMIISPVDMNGAFLTMDVSLLSPLYVKAYDIRSGVFVRCKCTRVNELTRVPKNTKFLMKIEQDHDVRFGPPDGIFDRFPAIRNFFCVNDPDFSHEKTYYLLKTFDYEMESRIDGSMLTISCRIKVDEEGNELNLHSIGQIEQLQDRVGKFGGHLHWRLESGKWEILSSHISFVKRSHCETRHTIDDQTQTVPNCEDDASDEEIEMLVKTLLTPAKNRIHSDQLIELNSMKNQLSKSNIKYFLFYYDDDALPMCIDSTKLGNALPQLRPRNWGNSREWQTYSSAIINLLKDPYQKIFQVNYANCILSQNNFIQYTIIRSVQQNDINEFVSFGALFYELLTDPLNNELHESYITECPKLPSQNTKEKTISPFELQNILEEEDTFLSYTQSNTIHCMRVDNFLRYEDQIDSIFNCEKIEENLNLCLCNQRISIQKQIKVITKSSSTVYKEMTPKSGSTISLTDTHTVQFKPLTKNQQGKRIELWNLKNLLEDIYFIVFYKDQPVCHVAEDFKKFYDQVKSLSLSLPSLPLNNQSIIIDTLLKRNSIFSTSLGNCLRRNWAKKVPQYNLAIYRKYGDPLTFELAYKTIYKLYQLLPDADPVVPENEFICRKSDNREEAVI